MEAFVVEDQPQRSGRAAAILEADELARYRKFLGFLDEHKALVQRAREALERAEFVAGCVEVECARLWRELCEAHDLDPNVDYSLDASGRIFSQ